MRASWENLSHTTLILFFLSKLWVVVLMIFHSTFFSLFLNHLTLVKKNVLKERTSEMKNEDPPSVPSAL